jgi:hypothetical protein
MELARKMITGLVTVPKKEEKKESPINNYHA